MRENDETFNIKFAGEDFPALPPLRGTLRRGAHEWRASTPWQNRIRFAVSRESAREVLARLQYEYSTTQYEVQYSWYRGSYLNN